MSFQTSNRAFSRAVLVFSSSRASVTLLMRYCRTLRSQRSMVPGSPPPSTPIISRARLWRDSSFLLMSSTFFALQSASSMPSAPSRRAHLVASAPYLAMASLRTTKFDIFFPSIMSIPLTAMVLGQCSGGKMATWWNT